MAQTKASSIAIALAALLLAGGAGFVIRAELEGKKRPSPAEKAPEPQPGLKIAPKEAPPQASAAPSAPAAAQPIVCEDADCACHRRAALARLEQGGRNAESVLPELDKLPAACADSLKGVRAEALARTTRCAEARTLAEPLKGKGQGEVEFALGLCAFRAGSRDDARTLGRSAIAGGREAAGHLLLGMVAIESSQLDVAEVELEQAIRLAPEVADAQYNLGVVTQREAKYNKARSAYLKTLRIDPTYWDARYQLVLLTTQAGALLEARHHLDALRNGVGPADQRVKTAEARLREQAASGKEAITLPGSN